MEQGGECLQKLEISRQAPLWREPHLCKHTLTSWAGGWGGCTVGRLAWSPPSEMSVGGGLSNSLPIPSRRERGSF